MQQNATTLSNRQLLHNAVLKKTPSVSSSNFPSVSNNPSEKRPLKSRVLKLFFFLPPNWNESKASTKCKWSSVVQVCNCVMHDHTHAMHIYTHHMHIYICAWQQISYIYIYIYIYMYSMFQYLCTTNIFHSICGYVTIVCVRYSYVVVSLIVSLPDNGIIHNTICHNVLWRGHWYQVPQSRNHFYTFSCLHLWYCCKMGPATIACSQTLQIFIYLYIYICIFMYRYLYMYIYIHLCQTNTSCCFQCFLGAEQYQKGKK